MAQSHLPLDPRLRRHHVGRHYLLFTWLDARLSEEEKAVSNTGTTAQLWMVHSGGFYVVEKRKVPDLVSRRCTGFAGRPQQPG